MLNIKGIPETLLLQLVFPLLISTFLLCQEESFLSLTINDNNQTKPDIKNGAFEDVVFVKHGALNSATSHLSTSCSFYVFLYVLLFNYISHANTSRFFTFSNADSWSSLE